jgi:hypothetical protein
MKPAMYVCIIATPFEHKIKTADSFTDFPKWVKDYLKQKHNKGEWILFKTGDDGKIHRCYSNGRKNS